MKSIFKDETVRLAMVTQIDSFKQQWAKKGTPHGQATLGIEYAKEETLEARRNIMATVPGTTVWPFISAEELSGSQFFSFE